MAIDVILSMHGRNAVAGDAGTRQAVLAGLVAFASTRTVDVVIEKQGHLAGHLLYLVHTTKSGSKLGRPMFRTYEKSGAMPTEVVLQTVARVVEMDLTAVQGSVRGDIQKGGGLSLCTQLEKLIRR